MCYISIVNDDLVITNEPITKINLFNGYEIKNNQIKKEDKFLWVNFFKLTFKDTPSIDYIFVVKDDFIEIKPGVRSLYKINSGNAKIAFITAIYGLYEATCKKPADQTIHADFICFTNLKNITSNGWIIDNMPYHDIYKSRMDNNQYINSVSKNRHTFNLAKYYKQNYYNIPCLKKYDVVVWLDGTIQITNEITAEWVLDTIQSHPIITIEHPSRSGKLSSEAEASNWNRYTSTFYFGQPQPYQDVNAQYKTYIEEGYKDSWENENPNFGVWITCFVAMDVKKVINFLDLWYLQTLKYTTQDQIGFPYVVQKTGILPHTIPYGHLSPPIDTTIYIKHEHGL